VAGESVSVDWSDGIAALRIDDGKANALSPALLSQIGSALDDVEGDAKSVVLAGRPGRFSAGFDLSVMGKGGEAALQLVAAGARLCVRLLEFPRPVVVACTGHAIAAGALVLACGDFRIGARGAFKLGLNEVAIGLALPHFGRAIARERLSKRHLARATAQAELYSPEGALDAGYLDALAAPEDLLDTALEHARRLSALAPGAFAHTKRSLVSDVTERIRARLNDDLRYLLPPS